MDFKECTKQLGKDHLVQRLYVHWDITTFCQYKCSYCYARKEYENKWMQPGNWEKQQRVIEELSKSTLPIFLGLLGGEPTMHPRYWQLLEKLITDFLPKHDMNRLYITTNAARDLEFFEKHIYDSKIRFLWSYHAEYADSKDFLEKVKAIAKKGFKNRVNIMLHPNKKYWKDLKWIFIELKKLQNIGFDIELHPHFIYTDVHNTIKYSNEFYKFFDFIQKETPKEFEFYVNGKQYDFSDIEVFENKYNRFKYWKCWNNNYEINLDCKVNQFCFEEKHEIPKDFFKNITTIIPVICKHDYCSCDGLLKIKKEKVCANM